MANLSLINTTSASDSILSMFDATDAKARRSISPNAQKLELARLRMLAVSV